MSVHSTGETKRYMALRLFQLFGSVDVLRAVNSKVDNYTVLRNQICYGKF